MTTVDEILTSANPLSLAFEDSFDGTCACCSLVGDGWEVEVHCWRVYFNGCGCEYSGIHVRGLPADVGRRVAEHVRDHNGWTGHTDFSIVVE